MKCEHASQRGVIKQKKKKRFLWWCFFALPSALHFLSNNLTDIALIQNLPDSWNLIPSSIRVKNLTFLSIYSRGQSSGNQKFKTWIKSFVGILEMNLWKRQLKNLLKMDFLGEWWILLFSWEISVVQIELCIDGHLAWIAAIVFQYRTSTKVHKVFYTIVLVIISNSSSGF